MYEAHIYTMGTRNYASAVANVIDPDNTIFNERILSRDESGSKLNKS
jgi:RNA polymerase II subunit A-like phosphatase